MSNTKDNVSPQREYKSRLFTLIFGDKANKENILSLYNALYNTNHEDVSDVEITTLEDVLYINMKNDVSFLLDSYLTLAEQQSTFNPNMPVRGLMYYGELYNSYIDTRDINIYSSALKKLPTPKYVVFYNGTDEHEPIEKLKLSDAFIHEDSDHEFEWTATMINLNVGKNDELLEKCKPLSDYMTFVNKVNFYKAQKTHTLGEAIAAAINYCIANDVMAEFLRKHRGDVMSTCLTEFKQELYEKDLLEEGRKEGRIEGREEGRIEGREEGRIEGREEGRIEGREEGRIEGREEGRIEGREEGRIEGREEGRIEGREEGRIEGREEGQKNTSIENAKNLFRNGVSYELIRASIAYLTDEDLQAIYSEVIEPTHRNNF